MAIGKLAELEMMALAAEKLKEKDIQPYMLLPSTVLWELMSKFDHFRSCNSYMIESLTECTKALKSRNKLRDHQCMHFKSILQKRYANLASNTKCLLCLKTFDKTGRLWIHIGNSHGKLDEILKTKKETKLMPMGWMLKKNEEEINGKVLELELPLEDLPKDGLEMIEEGPQADLCQRGVYI
jgi:hypothetical protein